MQLADKLNRQTQASTSKRTAVVSSKLARNGIGMLEYINPAEIAN
jgi:hypothetical protein